MNSLSLISYSNFKNFISRIESGQVFELELYKIPSFFYVESSLFQSKSLLLSNNEFSTGSLVGAFKNKKATIPCILKILKERLPEDTLFYSWPEHLEIYNKGVELIVFNRLPGIFGLLKRFSGEWSIDSLSTEETFKKLGQLLYNI